MSMSLETHTVQPSGSEESDELSILVLQDEKQREKQFEELNGIRQQEQAHNSSVFKDAENMHELSTMIRDVYALSGPDKFGHDLIQFIEPGHNLDNWQHHGYSNVETDSFSPDSHLDGDSIVSMAQCTCINEDIESNSEASVTLTVLNSTNTDDSSQAIPFSMTQPVTQHSLIDHDYYAYSSHKQEYSVTECLSVDNNDQILEQNDIGMDQEKLQRMKRRREKNRECSRQFRLKQKSKEQRLTFGKIEKTKMLESTRRNVEKFKAILTKISQKCSDCPKTAMLLSQYVTGSDKENINPNIAHNYFK